MSAPIRNWTPPTTDGRLALETFRLYTAQSAATKDGKVPDVRDVIPTLESVDAEFARVFGR